MVGTGLIFIWNMVIKSTGSSYSMLIIYWVKITQVKCEIWIQIWKLKMKQLQF